MFALFLFLTAQAAEPADFGDDARLLYRVVACSGSTEIPAQVDASSVEKHCQRMNASLDRYRKTYFRAIDFIGKELPVGAPTNVVYPFGGGDLITALTTYPSATDITTMSLEQAGDPRRIGRGVSKKKLDDSLELVRDLSLGLLHYNDSRTENLQKLQRGELPGQLSLFLLGLAAHGFEPVHLYFIRVETDGTVHRLTKEEIDALDDDPSRKLKKAWVSPDFSPAFADSELWFRKVGDPNAPLRVHRHFAANLANDQFRTDGPMMAYLNSKAPVSAMTKAASYLLWRQEFSNIRDYLLSHLVVMVSDSTGIPPTFLGQAEFEITTFGTFESPFLGASPKHAEAFRKVFHGAKGPLAFRYGYIDGSVGKHYHMMIVRRQGAAPSEPKAPQPPPATMPKSTQVKEGVPNTGGESMDAPTTEVIATSTHSVVRDDGGPVRITVRDQIEGGQHLRLITSHGAAHVWMPKGYAPKKAGTVVYVHGYGLGADQAWAEQQLAKQFAQSKRNALYIVPDAPASDDEDVSWDDLGKLLAEIESTAKLTLPKGPLAVVAHSGGYRQVVEWLGHAKLSQIILLDGLYAQDQMFAEWVLGPGGKSLVLVSVDTAARAARLERAVEDESSSREGARPKLTVLRSPYGHKELVTSGKVIPVMLGLTSIRMIP